MNIGRMHAQVDRLWEFLDRLFDVQGKKPIPQDCQLGLNLGIFQLINLLKQFLLILLCGHVALLLLINDHISRIH